MRHSPECGTYEEPLVGDSKEWEVEEIWEDLEWCTALAGFPVWFAIFSLFTLTCNPSVYFITKGCGGRDQLRGGTYMWVRSLAIDEIA